MSLLINNLKPKIADKDITCYKLVERTKIKGVYKAQYQEFEYIIRQLYTNNCDIEDVAFHIRYNRYLGEGLYIIREGMFHSFIDYLFSAMLKNSFPNYTLLKCVIPKGAYYFKGTFGTLPSYASSQIKILEEI